MNTLEQQALFEIVMAVGNGMDLHPMLQSSLSMMMRKLGCNMGVVARSSQLPTTLVHSIPHHVKNSDYILYLCEQAQVQAFTPGQPQLIEAVDQSFMLFELPNYGVLFLAKTGAPLSKRVLGTLTLIANKLALACIACEQARVVQESQQKTQLILDSAAEGIFGVDIQGNCTFANRSFLNTFGYSAAAEVIGSPIHEVIQPFSATNQTSEHALLPPFDQQIHAQNARFWRRDGSCFPVEYWSFPIEHAGQTSGAVITFFDITERKAAEDQIKNLAFFDPLTQLPNRRLVLDRLEHALIASNRSGREGALLFLDLDNFKTLNDTLGHDKGDLLLQHVANRLSACIRECDTAARFGGDEFLIILEDLSDCSIEAATHVTTIAEKILAALNQPYFLDGHEYNNSPSIGITLFTDCKHSVDELMKRADMAMYQAKAAGRNALRFFDEKMQTVVSQRSSLEKDLREGIQQQQFILYYQPQVNHSGEVTGAEALLRWQHPLRGMVSPAEFIPVAEETGLILPLGFWVLHSACIQLAAWAQTKHLAHLSLAVNVSARQFRQAQFVEQIIQVIKNTGANPKRLKIELTESMLLDDVEDIIQKMSQLQALGVRFALDDFGTGYSSLSYLKRLPLDQLKIDQSFVRDVLIDPHDAAIATTIVALAKSMGLTVIAEGVETIEQQLFLANQGCFAYQGYLYSRPIPISGFESMVTNAKTGFCFSF